MTTRRYWEQRYRDQGVAYVAKGGLQSSYDAQKAALEPMIRHAVNLNDTVLDFGCGPGRFREAIESVGGNYVGCDLIEELGTEPLADALAEPERYDLVVAVFVLQHITDSLTYARTLLDIHRVLKPSGRLFVVDHEIQRKFASHMRPRGWLSIMQHGFRMLGTPATYDGHWLATFEKIDG